MFFIVVSGKTISNIIVCDDAETAARLGAVPYYEGACIGQEYAPPMTPPAPPSQEERITALEDALCEQDAAASQRMADIEDALCQLDAAGKVGV